MWSRLTRTTAAVHRAGGGLFVDLSLYVISTAFAIWTASSSTLAPHRAWGAIAAIGYGCAAIVSLIQLAGFARPGGIRRRTPAWSGNTARSALAGVTWISTAIVPLVIEAVQRAGGRTDRAQEEVLVIEDGGRRLWETGSPYLDRAAIAGLPPGDRLLAYLPYQPGMGVFGVPRALDPTASWWSDARVSFALFTAVCIGLAFAITRTMIGDLARSTVLVRALQAVAVVPICALTLATGGDDLPVLALCLLALALVSTRLGGGRWGWCGIVIGTAAALKLFAWPVAVVLAVYAITQSRRATWRYLAGAVGVPLVTALPVLANGPSAMIENVLAFPLGRGLVTSPAASPLPGHLIATGLPGGRLIAMALLAAAGLVAAVVAIRRPPRSAADVALFAGLGLLAGFLLLPATRFGYLLYPLALLAWVPALRQAGPIPEPVRPEVLPLSTTAPVAG